MNYVIFSIDNEHDPATLGKFRNYLMGAPTEHNVIECLGKYEGYSENAFICEQTDFSRHILQSGYLENQKCFLHVSGSKNMEASLHYANGGFESLGRLVEVSKEEAMKENSYTYRPDLNKYWVARK